MKAKRPAIFLGVVIAALLVVGVVWAIATGQPAQTPALSSTPAASVATVGMKPGERYHDIHTSKLKLQCETCHTTKAETYRDPLAQVYNLADRRACLSCHKEGSLQPFFGEDWKKAKVSG